MSPDDLARASAWLLGLLRVAPCVALLPGLGADARTLPLRASVALVLAMGLAVVPARAPDGPWMLAGARELAIGGALALVLALPFVALDHAGRLWTAHDAHAEPLARMLPWAGVAAFVGARGHHGALRALAASWEALPVGASRPPGALVEVCARATGDALAGALVVATSGLVALAATELLTALVARVAAPFSREAAAPLRAAVRLAVAAVALRACVEVALDLAARSLALARAMAG